jgi:hypothetical protein
MFFNLFRKKIRANRGSWDDAAVGGAASVSVVEGREHCPLGGFFKIRVITDDQRVLSSWK